MTRFRVVSHPDLRILRFDAESVVFNPVLWHTHLLNASAAFVLDCLEEAPANADELVSASADDTGEPTIPTAQVEGVLEELAGLGLIEPVPAGTYP